MRIGAQMAILLKQLEVAAETKLKRSHMYALIQKGEFPKPIKLSERSSAWVASEVHEWIESKIQQRDEEAAQ